MGPRLFRRGNESFSSATSPAAGTLQWGHVFSDVEITERLGPLPSRLSFNGATSFQTWKWRALAGKLHLPYSFNGATSFQTWKSQWLMNLQRQAEASMGPRLFRRGNDESTRLPIQITSLQWGHVFSDVEIKSTGGMKDVEIFLQWGHVFSDVEIE